MTTENSSADALTILARIIELDDGKMRMAHKPHPERSQEWKAYAAGLPKLLSQARAILAALPVEQPVAAPKFDKQKMLASAREHGMDLGDNPVAYEFYNKATGHAVVDYTRWTHRGHLTEKDGYEARPLVYAHAARAQPAPSPADERAAHALDCQYILDDNPWAICTCGKGSPNNPRAASANETGAEGATMRERFEAWAMGEFALAALPTRDGEGYHLIGVDDAWNTWKAALARSPAMAAEAVAQWRAGEPAVEKGKVEEFILAVRRKQSNNRVFVFGATYANQFTDDGLLEGRDGDEFVADGWHLCGIDMSGEYNEVYEPITLNDGDEILGWQPLPKWSDAAPQPAQADAPAKARETKSN